MCNIIKNPNRAYSICNECGQYLEMNAKQCDDCAEREYWEEQAEAQGRQQELLNKMSSSERMMFLLGEL